MTKTEALKTLTGKIGLTKKVAEYLLTEAAKYGNSPHLKCEVAYAEELGYTIADCRNRGTSSRGIWATPKPVNG